MSRRELRRVEVLARVQAEELKLIDAASLMGVSYRQAKRIGKRYREEGAEGMKHRSAGRRSSRAKPEKSRRQVLGLVRRKYSGEEGRRFGPTRNRSARAHRETLCYRRSGKVRTSCWYKNLVRSLLSIPFTQGWDWGKQLTAPLRKPEPPRPYFRDD
jgi:transposase